MEDKRHKDFREAIENSKNEEALENLMITLEIIAGIGEEGLSPGFVVAECKRYMAAYSKGSHARTCKENKEEQAKQDLQK